MAGLDYIEQVHTLHPMVAMEFFQAGLRVTIGRGAPFHRPGKSKVFTFSELNYSRTNPILAWIEGEATP